MNEPLGRVFFDGYVRPVIFDVIRGVKQELAVDYEDVHDVKLGDAIATIYDEFRAARYTLAYFFPHCSEATDEVRKSVSAAIVTELTPAIERAITDEAKHQLKITKRTKRIKPQA